MLGDFNARVGPVVKPTRLYGAHNPDFQNNNGDLDFCNNHGLVITSTLFPHRKIHQRSWRHPNQHEGGHVLDYVLVNHKFRSCILDTRTHRQSLHTSDHNPVVSKLRIDYRCNKNKKVASSTENQLKLNTINIRHNRKYKQ